MAFEAAVVGLPGNSYAFTNCVYVHMEDFMSLVKQTPKGMVTKDELRAHGLNVWLNRKFVLAAKPHKELEQGTVAVGTMQRMCVGLPMNEVCEVSAFGPSQSVLSTVTFEVQQVLTRAQGNDLRVVDCSLLKKVFENEYIHQVFTVGQLLAVRCDGLPLRLQCVNVDTVDGDNSSSASISFAPRHGTYLEGAIVSFTKAKDAPIRLTNQSSGTTRTVFKPDFDFTKLGIGGLDKEFNDIFRRAFASRLFPTDVIQKLGIQHVRGMLLFGPPGCGKTLIARKISQALTAKEPKVVNGPEILDKFVGESERKIRELFSDARKDQEELGDESDVHIIIFDEIDAICKQRGSSRDSTGVGDSVVNQLLTQIDGVDSLNNVLVIGMTNRKIEINLPDDKGRAQILKIHTDRAREKGALHPKVIADLDNCLDSTKIISKDPDYKNLVQRTKNFSGAEIEGLVRAATAHALSRGTDGRTMHAIANYNPEISMEDFALALDEVKPKFGAPSDQLALYYKNGLIPYGVSFTDVRETLARVIDQVRSNDKTPLMSVLLHGERGAGKTALATYCAVASEFPLVRMVKASELISRAESGKCSFIYNVFEEAYRSPLGIIILDDIERLIDYVGMGPRFSNLVLQALMVLVRNPVPVAGRKLVVIGITSNMTALQGVELSDVFDLCLEVPQLTQKEEVEMVLTQTGLPVADDQKHEILTLLSDRPISVKKLLLVTEMAKEELNRTGESTITAQQLIECVYKFV
uniref:Vesicle-fusing ATPase n=1 Tax=Hyaloperonospora arabidopsidis (strain Emoy2) TaxID=559515 RepID=M4B764_HYAAE